MNYLEKYRTDRSIYIFHKVWFKETQGYAVSGSHMSYGENRCNKNWAEIESTFYVQIIKHNIG